MRQYASIHLEHGDTVNVTPLQLGDVAVRIGEGPAFLFGTPDQMRGFLANALFQLDAIEKDGAA